jgi:hypothetical protein
MHLENDFILSRILQQFNFQTADDILLSVLNEMKRIHLGLPETTVEALKRGKKT